MKKYYTRACNFFYGKSSIKLVNQKKTLPLKVIKKFHWKIRNYFKRFKKIIDLKDIKKLSKTTKKKN